MKPGRFISLEGIDGAGKSAQIGRLADWLRSTGRGVATCRDPGSTPVGDAVRDILLDRHDLHLAATAEMFPTLGRLRLLRQWAGIVDVVADSSPIIGPTPVPGLSINCGWGTGGFKAIPGSGFVFADTIANGRPHPIAEPFSLNRFAEGRLIDESVAAAVAH